MLALYAAPATGKLLTLAPVDLAAPLFVAAGLSAATALIALLALPESLPADRRSDRMTIGDLNPIRTVSGALSRPSLRPLLLAFGLMGFALAVLATSVPVFALDVLTWGPTQVGLLLSAVGVTDIVVQGGLLGIALRVLGERRLVMAGLAGIAVANGVLVLVGWLAPFPWLLVAATLLFAMAEGATGATLQGMLSRAAGEDEQGWLAGAMSAIGSITQLVGPLLAGVLYAQVSRTAPYALGVAVVLVALALVRRPNAVADGGPVTVAAGAGAATLAELEA